MATATSEPYEAEGAQETAQTGQPALCVLAGSAPRLWGSTLAERTERQFVRAGLDRFVSADEAALEGGHVILVRADAVIDQPLVPILIARRDFVLMGEGADGPVPVAAHVSADRVGEIGALLMEGRKPPAALKLTALSPDELEASFWQSLRKRETPYAMVVDETNRADVEWRMFMGTYKGATDFITKHVWPWPAFLATRWLAPTFVTPNMVTTVSAVLMVAAFFLFLQGSWALGLVCAWGMTFLDTVDGKLARVTLTSSKWGDVFDHGIDLVHPPFWYVAWGLGLKAVGLAFAPATLFWVLTAIIAGYVLQRVMEGVAIQFLKLEIHIWRRMDTLFRQITARRNPNLAILTVSALIGRPDWGLVAVAVWTVLCLVLHGLQLAQALAEKRRTGTLSSWLNEPAQTER
ncbi:CDP-alcohol phosphatidyltransferase family protein [Kaustia mangrovi]|uniref:CDP-alcohol phosphatidyltransferase family protein n=2 Tax=Kaustia mangrovi TaxID=2593653 RepID=A0A7S8C8K3_9HYPH|nr:CDP-alcohol phosphatidyltransferase family protein [Kaustia mangrovi]